MSLSVSSYSPSKLDQLPTPAEAAIAARQAQIQAVDRQIQQAKAQTEDRRTAALDPFIGTTLDVTA